jgi:hypothetical protein
MKVAVELEVPAEGVWDYRQQQLGAMLFLHPLLDNLRAESWQVVE